MGVLEHSQATLRIFGDDLIPEDVSNLLGAKATKSKKKGDEEVGKSSGKVHIAKTGSWHLHAGKRVPEDLNAQIEEILSQLTSDLAIWEKLHQNYEVDMFCGLFMGNWNDGLSLSPEIMLALGKRKIVLNLDIYSGSDE
ncbi:DUF4279 domain-containing protein [Arsukibacterium indicum]|uniref:DUF4279 domain-containing protein n=1 Tax=Arsukibacterium indicum TaxID=2848612 RepID=A0ABS6MHR2_9GAMM|nr:DUF4279 domain-containing protein [Arsukibacterium indicum]MBV2128356.1 DUF4279 domain-containing protein [Arsukibacterium indicum]